MKKLRKGTWTKEENRIMHSFYTRSSTAQVAAMLGRPTQNVKKQASRLGLKKCARYRREVLHRRK